MSRPVYFQYHINNNNAVRNGYELGKLAAEKLSPQEAFFLVLVPLVAMCLLIYFWRSK